ncbi:MAG TPA: SDR family NAD(P)-dependent oxidoreductase [Solirubrobacteraceae bacterium]
MTSLAQRLEGLSPLQRALLALEEAQARLDALEHERDEPIAVVGVGCRFPGGADGPAAYWDLLREGRDGIVEVPADRWDADALYDPDPDAPGRTYARHGGFLREVDRFDARLFGIAPREAAFMDPQQRLLLEVAWEALEASGIAPDALAGSAAGAFVGISTSDYGHRAARHLHADAIDAYVSTGTAHSIAANRLSYVLGLRGPSIAVDTACSSALVAVHLACASLRTRECGVALAGGVNLMLLPETTMNFTKARMLSPQGRCRTFDARADGYVRGEGCGVVVLKRLSDAEAEGDHVLAVIRGSAVNQDGRSNGLTAPHGPSQEDVIRRALAQARVRPDELAYVEAHGTGTPLGDPIELAALGRVLGARERPALIGSAKTNLGHLEAAAGVAGLIKVVLALQHDEVPPHLHFEQPSPHVAWPSLPLRVVTERTPFPADARRVAGVSSFGFGGTNAHVVLEAAPAAAAAPSAAAPAAARPAVLVKLAARGADARTAAAARLRDRVAADDAADLAAIARAACVGRAELPDRAAVVARTPAELVQRLGAVAAGADVAGVAPGRTAGETRPRLALLVPGQGTRYAGAAAGLYRHEPAAARALDELAEVLGPIDRLPLAALLEPGEDGDRALARTEVAQPALYALALALAAWWESVGVRPDAVAGHSVGAYAAAALAGVFSRADGARLVTERGRLMGELPAGGAMAAVAVAADRIEPLLAGGVVVAARNGAADTVLSGPEAEVERICAALRADGARVQRLEVSHAFHSPLVEPALAGLERALAGIALAPPATTFVSDTSGAIAGEEVATPAYWIAHARQPVDFAGTLSALRSLGCRQLVELGPGSMLLALARRHEATRDATALPSLSSRREPTEQLLESLGRAWTEGASVDWKAASPDVAPADLPTYPFQRRRHWFEEGRHAEEGAAAAGDEASAPVADEAAGAPPPTDALGSRPALLALLHREVARVVGLDPSERIEPDQGLFELGLDSLMAVELQRSLSSTLDRELPVTLALDHPTIDALADFLLAQPRRRGSSRRSTSDEPVAIVGMACRLPGGADDLDGYWALLRDGVDAVGTVPPSRWDADALYDPDPDAPLRMNTRSGGFLRGPVDEFDADMFGIAPREAASMDPQQRLLLEVAWEALEDAGLAGALAGAAAGVFVGINTADYLQLLSASGGGAVDAYVPTGNTASVAAGRISYLLGLQGPSLAVDTACSSSLVALHLACRSLRDGESDAALAGGVNLMLSPATSIGMAKLHALSPDGRCKAFDASADGYGRAEGCGVVVLKRLPDAVADGDRVWALVRGSAVNQDGRSAGLTVPNGPSQEAVIREALEVAGVEPARVGYVEAHGTGTPLGDPIELQAIGAALGDGARERPVTVGSVKTNLGHLEAAAGVAGVIKVALAMRHRTIPAHLHLHEPSPWVPWDDLPVHVPTTAEAWTNGDGPRVAGVSSFGFSGTNAHVVLEEPPEPAIAPPPADAPDLLVLSARSEAALDASVRRHGELLAAPGAPAWRDVCFTAATRRTHHPHRVAVVASSAAEAADRLAAHECGDPEPAVRRGRSAEGPLILCFCGQGAQWPGMGRELLAAQPAFRRAVERCDAVVREEAGWSVTEALQDGARLDDTEIAQPLVLALQVGLAALWRSWGAVPAAVVGHSVGEVAAAHVAGALSLPDAVRIVVRRGRLMQGTKGDGAMAVLGIAPEEVPSGVAVAALNGPSATVVSGTPDAVEAAVAATQQRRAFARRLPGAYAFHSEQMRPLAAELAVALDGIDPRPPRIPVLSTVTGAAHDRFDAAHWAANMAEPVRFHEALVAALGPGHNLVLEVGPHPVLAGAIGQCLAAEARSGTAVASMRRDAPQVPALLDAAAALFVSGQPLDHRARCAPDARSVPLPSYPWQRRRYWLPGADAATVGRERIGGYALLQRRIDAARPGGERLFEGDLDPAEHAERLAGEDVVPAGIVLEAVLEAVRFALPATGHVLRDLVLDEPPPAAGPLQVALAPDGGFEVYVGRTRAAAGRAEATEEPPAPVPAAAAGAAVTGPHGAAHVAHPALDAALRLVTGDGRVPTAIASLHVHGVVPRHLTAHAGGAGARLLDGDGRTVVAVEGVKHRPLGAAAQLRGMTYEIAWTERQRPPSPNGGTRPGRWAILGDGDGVGARLLAALGALGHECELLRDARELTDAGALRGVVHLLGLEQEASPSRECGALLDAVHAGARVWIATRGTQPVGDEHCDPARGPLWGLARVVALEHPELWGGAVDLDPAATPRDDVEALLAELHATDFEDQVAYRGGARHAARLVRAPLEPADRELALRGDGAYLVTGGRGALGLKVAAWLARRGARHLVLTGRGAPDAAATDAIRALEHAGVTVAAPRVDVTDAEAMAAVLREAPPLRGVIHAAGLFRPTAIADMTRADLEEVLAPKVAGSRVLDELTRDADLDFFVLFSSAASVWGSALAGHYVAANHFQDLLAHRRRALGLPALAVNWGWWDGSDMVHAEAKAYFAALGLDVVPEDLGLAALEQLILDGCAQRTIAPVDWRRFKPAFTAKRPRPLLDEIEIPEAAAGGASAEGLELIARLQAAAPEDRRAIAVEFVQQEVGAVLGRPPGEAIDPDLGFFEAGMDSLTTVELKTRLETRLGRALPATLAFERPTIGALAAFLLDEVLDLGTAPEPETEQRDDGMEALSEDELLDLLAREVGR